MTHDPHSIIKHPFLPCHIHLNGIALKENSKVLNECVLDIKTMIKISKYKKEV